jgi:hypothetical protein
MGRHAYFPVPPRERAAQSPFPHEIRSAIHRADAPFRPRIVPFVGPVWSGRGPGATVLSPSTFEESIMTDTSSNFSAILREVWDVLNKAARYGMDTLSSLSWTNLAVACILLALVLTVIPLALGLFLAFMVAKLLLAAVQDRRKGKATPYTDLSKKDEG